MECLLDSRLSAPCRRSHGSRGCTPALAAGGRRGMVRWLLAGRPQSGLPLGGWPLRRRPARDGAHRGTDAFGRRIREGLSFPRLLSGRHPKRGAARPSVSGSRLQAGNGKRAEAAWRAPQGAAGARHSWPGFSREPCPVPVRALRGQVTATPETAVASRRTCPAVGDMSGCRAARRGCPSGRGAGVSAAATGSGLESGFQALAEADASASLRGSR